MYLQEGVDMSWGGCVGRSMRGLGWMLQGEMSTAWPGLGHTSK